MKSILNGRFRLVAAAAAAVLVGTAPAAFATGLRWHGGILGFRSVSVSGNVPLHPGGREATAYVVVDFKRGPGHKLEFADVGHRVSFHATRFTSAVWSDHALRLKGFGVERRKVVPFTALIVSGGEKGRDAFLISWNHCARRGGDLSNGSVVFG